MLVRGTRYRTYILCGRGLFVPDMGARLCMRHAPCVVSVLLSPYPSLPIFQKGCEVSQVTEHSGCHDLIGYHMKSEKVLCRIYIALSALPSVFLSLCLSI